MLENFKKIYDKELSRICNTGSSLEQLILDSHFVRGFVYGVCKEITVILGDSNMGNLETCEICGDLTEKVGSSIRKKIAECLTKVEAHVKNRNYGMALKMQGAAVALQEVLDEIESTSQSNTLVDGDKLCDFCGPCDFQKQKRKKNSG